MDLLLAKAKPVRDGGNTSMMTYIRRKISYLEGKNYRRKKFVYMLREVRSASM